MTGPRDINVLIVTLGLSGAVVTETLWSLARERDSWPDEVRLIATEEARRRLETDVRQKVIELAAASERSAPLMSFIVAQSESGGLIGDIRTQADAVAFGDMVTDQIRRVTATPQAKLHVSIAGGRKTMSFHAGAAMQIYARVQDRLSHVLVDPPAFEARGFWWPTQPDQVITTREGTLRAVDATVELADIPFVRLRSLIPENDLALRLSYAEVVRFIDSVARRTPLILELKQCRIRYGEFETSLPGAEFALYYFLAERAKAGIETPFHIREMLTHRRDPYKRILEIYGETNDGWAIVEKWREEYNKFEEGDRLATQVALRHGPMVSKLRNELNRAFPQPLMRQRFGIGARSRMLLALRPDEIELQL